MEDPPKKFFRLRPGGEVRLRWGFFLHCHAVEKDASGRITLLRCTIDPATRGGDAPDGRKVKSTIHWVSATHVLSCTARLVDRLFVIEQPDADKESDFRSHLNQESMNLTTVLAEPSVAELPVGAHLQFERIGYFCVDPQSTTGRSPVLNRTVGLRDDWAKATSKEA